MLADAGWRVVAGTSAATATPSTPQLYSWEADVRDALAVLDSIGPRAGARARPLKGGALMLQLADAVPAPRAATSINLDGLPSRRSWPDVAEHERTRLLAGELAAGSTTGAPAVDAHAQARARSTSWPSAGAG